MTVANTEPGAVEAWDPTQYDGDTGLEDVGAGDVVIPRLQIQHTEGVFKDNLSGAEFPELRLIILGLIKQRIMWSDDVEDGEKPLCKSPDHVHGFPNQREDLPVDKRFPWSESNFDPSHAQPLILTPGADPVFPNGWNSNGLNVLPCASCKFQLWGNDKNGKSVPPMCTEQHTYGVLYSPEEGVWTSALLTLQRTGIKPSKTYVSSFAQQKQPMFTVETTLTLNQQSRGSVKYCVPIFKKGPATDRNQWLDYANTYRSIRDFVRSAPRRQDEEEDGAVVEPSSNENTAPAAAVPQPATLVAEPPAASPPQATATEAPAAAPPVATPAAAPAPPPPAAAVADDDLPF